MPAEPLVQAPYPAGLEPDNVPQDLKELAEHLARFSVLRFTDEVARDAAFAAANLSPEAGMTAYVGGRLTVYSGSSWDPVAIAEDLPYGIGFKSDANSNFPHVVPWTAELLAGGITIPAATPTRLVVPRGGVYRMTANARINTGPTAGAPQIQIRKNAAGVNNQGIRIGTIWENLPANVTNSFTLTKSFSMAANEYVELFCYGPTDGFVHPLNDQTYFELTYVRAA